jgi:hypothetical protein
MGLLLRHGDRSSVSAGGRRGGGSGKIAESPLADNGLQHGILVIWSLRHKVVSSKARP